MTNLSMENNAMCWNVAANCILVRKSTLFWSRVIRFKFCARSKTSKLTPCSMYLCVYLRENMHHTIGYTSSSAITLFSRNLVKNTTSLPTARYFRLFVPTESILIPSGSLYTNRSQIVPPEAKRHAHRESDRTGWERAWGPLLNIICIPHTSFKSIFMSAAQNLSNELPQNNQYSKYLDVFKTNLNNWNIYTGFFQYFLFKPTNS